VTCEYLDDYLRWKFTKSDMTEWNNIIFKIEAKHHNFTQLSEYKHELGQMELTCNKCGTESKISFKQLKIGFKCPSCNEQLISSTM